MALITLGFGCPHHTCLPLQPHAAPSNPTHPISATLAYFPFCDCAKPSPTSGTLLELFFCLEQSLFSQLFKRLARFIFSCQFKCQLLGGKLLLTKLGKQPKLHITQYSSYLYLYLLSVFVV